MINPTQLEGWIESQIRDRWPNARALTHEEREGDVYFQMRCDGKDLWLILQLRAYRGLAMDELAEFLTKQRWLDRLLVDRCLCVRLLRIHPTLDQIPDLVV